MTDALGSVRGYVGEYNAVLSNVNYSEYGVPSAPITGFAFTGEWRDQTGLQYHRARYLSPALGGWLSRDEFEDTEIFNQGIYNAYNWANGDPINFADPTGWFSISSGSIASAYALGFSPTRDMCVMLFDQRVTQEDLIWPTFNLEEFLRSKVLPSAVMINIRGAAAPGVALSLGTLTNLGVLSHDHYPPCTAMQAGICDSVPELRRQGFEEIEFVGRFGNLTVPIPETIFDIVDAFVSTTAGLTLFNLPELQGLGIPAEVAPTGTLNQLIPAWLPGSRTVNDDASRLIHVRRAGTALDISPARYWGVLNLNLGTASSPNNVALFSGDSYPYPSVQPGDSGAGVYVLGADSSGEQQPVFNRISAKLLGVVQSSAPPIFTFVGVGQ